MSTESEKRAAAAKAAKATKEEKAASMEAQSPVTDNAAAEQFLKDAEEPPTMPVPLPPLTPEQQAEEDKFWSDLDAKEGQEISSINFLKVDEMTEGVEEKYIFLGMEDIPDLQTGGDATRHAAKLQTRSKAVYYTTASTLINTLSRINDKAPIGVGITYRGKVKGKQNSYHSFSVVVY